VPSTTAGTDQLPSSQETTIDRHADAIDEISLVRYEEGDEVSDVPGLANATYRDVGQEIAFVLRRDTLAFDLDQPGATAFTLMPCGPNFCASDFVNVTTPEWQAAHTAFTISWGECVKQLMACLTFDFDAMPG
jgi:hypothetical protein